jgi:hypothetical protein
VDHLTVRFDVRSEDEPRSPSGAAWKHRATPGLTRPLRAGQLYELVVEVDAAGPGKDDVNLLRGAVRWAIASRCPGSRRGSSCLAARRPTPSGESVPPESLRTRVEELSPGRRGASSSRTSPVRGVDPPTGSARAVPRMRTSPAVPARRSLWTSIGRLEASHAARADARLRPVSGGPDLR